MDKKSAFNSKLARAQALADQGDYEIAIDICRQILDVDAHCFEALSLIGLIYLQQTEYEAAVHALRRSLQLETQQIDTLNNLGLALDHLNQYTQAIACYQEALTLVPDYEPALINLSGSQIEIGDFEAARNTIDMGLERCPNNSMLINNQVVALIESEQYDQAIEYIDHRISEHDTNPDLLVNRARIFSLQGHYAQAIQYLKDANRLRPNNATTLYNLSLALLQQGNLTEGWKLYKWRFKATQGSEYLTAPWNSKFKLPYSKSNNRAQHGMKQLLAIYEQGIGDELFFLRYALLAKQHGFVVSYLPSPKLYTILENNLNIQANIRILDPASQFNPEQFDLIIAAGDLPIIINASSPLEVPEFTFQPNARLVEALNQKGRNLPKPWIGVTYKAGALNKLGKPDKEIDLRSLFKHVRYNKGTLFLLQRENSPILIEKLSASTPFKIVDSSWCADNLPDLAAVLFCLDDYITVSNSNIYIRACFGKPSTIIKTPTADFRLLANEKGDSAWFPRSKIVK